MSEKKLRTLSEKTADTTGKRGHGKCCREIVREILNSRYMIVRWIPKLYVYVENPLQEAPKYRK